LAQIIVTTYWGFYIDPDRTKSLLERLVIDPVFLYLVMILLVPLSFGFTYMMIKLAKNAEANAKLQPKKSGSGKSSINLPQRWIFGVLIALIAFQVYLNIAAYYAVINGMKNYSLFIVGIMMLVFAGMFHIFRHGRTMEKAPPPKPTVPATPLKSKPSPAVATVPSKPALTPPGELSKSTPAISNQGDKPLAPPPVAKGSSSSSSSSSQSSSTTQKSGDTKTDSKVKMADTPESKSIRE
jgi:ubiquinol-cytochrome c reductase cytochrome b subunit